MARALWSGSISFGLLNIPVQLMPGERRTELRFHMLDSRNKARVRYERINAETGEEVPWKDIVKAYEYKKGSYVVLEPEDLKAAAPESSEAVEIESFIDPGEVDARYFERPYYLVPPKKAEKGYVLLRETLKELKRAGLARVVIRTREYLALVLPRDQALVMILLRYPQEVIAADEYGFPERPLKSYRLSERELEMARQLVESMSSSWKPSSYHDEFRAKLAKVIQKRLRSKGAKVQAAAPEEHGQTDSDKVVDFMSVLKRSLEQNRRTPARTPASKKAPARKSRGQGHGTPRRRKRA